MRELPTYFRYWGKADPKYQGEPKWHPLAYHCLDVAAVAAVWLEQSPAIRRAFNNVFGVQDDQSARLRAWVLFFAALHDIGKLDVRFQLQSLQALAECWPDFQLSGIDSSFLIKSRFHHGQAGYAWASREYCEWIGRDDPMCDYWDVLRPWLAAVTGHHGELPETADISSPDGRDRDYIAGHDRDARKEWVETAERLFLRPVGIDLKHLPPLCDFTAQNLLAGFCSVCDWIGSNTREDAFPYKELLRNCEEYFNECVGAETTKRVLVNFGIVRAPLPYPGIEALLDEGNKPLGVQRKIDALPAVAGLTLIEAPTGSGKTEAALAYAWRLLETGCIDSIVFALPTQATADAMLERIEKFANKLFSGEGINVVLAHGKRNMSSEFQRLAEIGKLSNLLNKEDAAVQCAEWLAQSRKRVFLGQIGVCTIDQTLLSVLPVRHSFVRGFGLNKSVLIIDEVHAYDSYMYGLLDEVLRRQKTVGGSAILLSATLPLSIKENIFSAWGCVVGFSEDYPLITSSVMTNPLKLSKRHLPKTRTVFVECLTLPDALPDGTLIDRIIKAAEAGAKVAVVMNLVGDAQRTACDVRKKTTLPVDVFHSRYRYIDRQRKEKIVKDYYGKKAGRNGGRILVATQVVEQSLDLDFDWIITQICPIDLWFQRLGRLHRHKKLRPKGFKKARCTLLTMPNANYGLHKEIYGNTRYLWRTEQLAIHNEKFKFPEAYRRDIEAVYQRDDWDNEPDHIACDFDVFSSMENQKRFDAEQLTAMSVSRFHDEDERVTSLTRGDEMSLVVVPVLHGKRFLDGTMLSSIEEHLREEWINLNSVPVPASWGKYLHNVHKDDKSRFWMEFMTINAQEWTVKVGKTIFRYAEDFGLEKE